MGVGECGGLGSEGGGWGVRCGWRLGSEGGGWGVGWGVRVGVGE